MPEKVFQELHWFDYDYVLYLQRIVSKLCVTEIEEIVKTTQTSSNHKNKKLGFQKHMYMHNKIKISGPLRFVNIDFRASTVFSSLMQIIKIKS